MAWLRHLSIFVCLQVIIGFSFRELLDEITVFGRFGLDKRGSRVGKTVPVVGYRYGWCSYVTPGTGDNLVRYGIQMNLRSWMAGASSLT